MAPHLLPISIATEEFLNSQQRLIISALPLQITFLDLVFSFSPTRQIVELEDDISSILFVFAGSLLVVSGMLVNNSDKAEQQPHKR